jgi:glycosyltransferase involved in cell wall biosynthesis
VTRADRTVVVATVEHPMGETGVHTHFTEFRLWAHARGIRIRLVTPFQANPLLLYPLFGVGRAAKPVSIRFWVWWYRWSHALVLKRELMRQLLACGPSVVYAQDPMSAQAAIELRDAGYPITVALIVHFNGSHADELVMKGQIARGGRLDRAIRAFERSVFAKADRLIFPSRYAARATGVSLDVEPMPTPTPTLTPMRISIVPNFVSSPSRRPEGPAARGDAITIGTLEPRKNHEFILNVLAEAHRRGHRYSLTVVGSGPLASRLRETAARLGLERFVTFTGSRPDAAALLAHHRVYVHAAHLENCPIVLLEAMAAGVPAIASPVGGIPELLTDGIEGLFWDPRDVSSAADRLIELLDDEPRRRRMAAAASARYERDYTPDRCCPALLDALLSATDDAQRRADTLLKVS